MVMSSADAERETDPTDIETAVPWVLPLTRLVGEILAEALSVVGAHPDDDIPGLLSTLAVMSEQAGAAADTRETIPPAFWPASAEILRSLATYARAIIDEEGAG
jgi:hypothetical protein